MAFETFFRISKGIALWEPLLDQEHVGIRVESGMNMTPLAVGGHNDIGLTRKKVSLDRSLDRRTRATRQGQQDRSEDCYKNKLFHPYSV